MDGDGGSIDPTASDAGSKAQSRIRTKRRLLSPPLLQPVLLNRPKAACACAWTVGWGGGSCVGEMFGWDDCYIHPMGSLHVETRCQLIPSQTPASPAPCRHARSLNRNACHVSTRLDPHITYQEAQATSRRDERGGAILTGEHQQQQQQPQQGAPPRSRIGLDEGKQRPKRPKLRLTCAWIGGMDAV